MSNQTDQYYIKLVLSGKVNNYAFLVERYKHMVFTLAVRILNNKELAEEIGQDVFVKAYKNLASFKGESKFSTWLYKIAYFTSLDAVKREKKHLKVDNLDTFNEINLVELDKDLEDLESEERKKVIKAALQKLKEDEKTIVTLFYFEQLSLKEIAKVLNYTEENVKVKLFRTRKKMASLLKNVIEPNTMNVI